MKQKLGLACTLVRSPELLLLDEPTVGVDPLSRRELWEIVRRLVADQGLTVLLSTAYLDEAERCSRVIMLHQGRVLSQGSPQQVTPLAAGPQFRRRPRRPGSRARTLQARLLDRAGHHRCRARRRARALRARRRRATPAAQQRSTARA